MTIKNNYNVIFVFVVIRSN